MKESGIQMSPAERAAASVLVVETDAGDRTNLKTALKQLAFGTIVDAPNHLACLDKFNDRKFTHVIFDAKKTNYPMKDWLTKVFELAPNIVAIPASGSPSVDDVFDLLVIGAKGYLVKPFTFDTVDQAVVMATKGEPISEAVLQARDRNEALVAIMMSSLDKFATIYRQSQQFETAKRELPRAMAILKRSADLAHTFAKGGEEGLIEALERFCIERSKGPASKLGRLRKRLTNTRSSESASAD
jgi:DNA-binding NarL/FixJ family response regulator